jgi:hypothetical protein
LAALENSRIEIVAVWNICEQKIAGTERPILLVEFDRRTPTSA